MTLWHKEEVWILGVQKRNFSKHRKWKFSEKLMHLKSDVVTFGPFNLTALQKTVAKHNLPLDKMSGKN